MTRLLASLLVAAGACAAMTGAPGIAAETRVLGISLTSPDAVGRAVASAAADGFDTLLASMPPLAGESRAADAFDPFDELLRRAGERRLRVHGVISVGLVSAGGDLPIARDHVVYQHPEWLMVPRALAAQLRQTEPRHPAYLGRLLRWVREQHTEGLYISPVYPDAAAYLATTLGRGLRRYAVDEITLDLRMPDTDIDFSPRAIELFAATLRPTLTRAERLRMDKIEALDPLAWADEYPALWARFQRERWEALLDRLRVAAAVERPGTVINAQLSGSGVPVALPSGSAGSR